MEHTQQYLLNKIGELEDKLKRIEEIVRLTEIQPVLKVNMVRGVLHPNEA